jgi:salicylate hydroxylase
MGDSPVLIAGGGIAGLATSLALAKAGRESIVLEQAAAFEEAGAGIQISPNAVRALQWLGALDAVEPHCTSPNAIVVRDGVTGNVLQRMALGQAFAQRFGAPYRVAMRSGLLAGLLAAAQSSSRILLRTSSTVASASPANANLTLSTGETLQGQAIIGADGVHSILRRSFDKVTLPHSHHIIFRQLLPGVDAEDVTLWLAPKGHIVQYPVSGRRVNVVACVEDQADGETPQLAKAGGELREHLHGAWSKWKVAERDARRPWRNEACVLVGDAAHASLPFLAQGAAMALEDACGLGFEVMRHGVVPDAFAAFAGKRMTRTAHHQIAARRMGRIYHASGALRLARNLALRAMDSSRFRDRMGWVYDWKPE